jgi:hypothetical protein
MGGRGQSRAPFFYNHFFIRQMGWLVGVGGGGGLWAVWCVGVVGVCVGGGGGWSGSAVVGVACRCKVKQS